MQAGDYISSKERREREEADAAARNAAAAATAATDAAGADAEEPPLLGKHPVLAWLGILVSVVSWIAKMALVQDMQTGSGGGVSSGGGGANSTASSDSTSYNKPFLTAYSNGSSYTFFGLVFLVFHLRLAYYLLCWTVWELRVRCCGQARKPRRNTAAAEELEASVQQSHQHQRRDSHSLSQAATGSNGLSGALSSDYSDVDPSDDEEEQHDTDHDAAADGDESILSHDGITPVGSYSGSGNGYTAKTPVAVIVQPVSASQHGRTESLGSNALLMQHLDRAAAARQHAQQRAIAERRKRRMLRLASLQDTSHLPALSREDRALLPQYSRLMRAAFCLSFLYQMCGWLTNASLNDTSLSVNTAIWNSGCVLVFLFEGLFLPGHTLRNTQKILGVLVCAAGVAIIAAAPAPADESSTATRTNAWGVTQVLIAMVLYSGYEVLFSHMSEQAETENTAAAAAATTAETKSGVKIVTSADDEDSLVDKQTPGGDAESVAGSYDPAQSPSITAHFVDAPLPPSVAQSYPPRTKQLATGNSALGINDTTVAAAASQEKLLSSSFDEDSLHADNSAASKGKAGAASFSSSSFATVPGLITAASATSLVSSGSSVAPKSTPVVADGGAMASIWSSFLFLGTMGFSILCTEWLMVLILHYTTLERLERPSPSALRIILASMALDTVLNVSILCSIALSTALFVQCGLLLTIPTSMGYDRLFHHQSPSWLSVVGVAVLVVGFVSD